MIILDTNVISELLKPRPNTGVMTWVDSQHRRDLYLTAITGAELLRGVFALDKGKRRDTLIEAIKSILSDDFAGRVLPFDAASAELYAMIAQLRQKAGRPISIFDCQIAAICGARKATLATRNVKDFDLCDVSIVNPWQPDT